MRPRFWILLSGVLLAIQCGLSAQGQSSRLVAGLWGAPSASREQALRSAILGAVGTQLAEIGFDDIAFEWTLDERRQYAQLGEGDLALLEVDPGVYFQARRYWLRTDPQRWQYEALFQRWAPVDADSGRRAAIVVLPQATSTRNFDLRGGILGVLGGYGLDRGAVQQASLRARGLQPGRDFLAVEAPGEDNLCKALVSGLVDAAALPEGAGEAFLERERANLPPEDEFEILYRSDLLPGRMWCIHRQLIQRHPDLAARLRYGLPPLLKEEYLIPTRDEYYLTTPSWTLEAE